MKIRHQLVLLIVFLAAIPFVYFIGQALFEFFLTSPESQFDKANEILSVKEMELSPKDKQFLLKTAQNRPMDAEEAFVLSDGTILISTISDFCNLESIDLNRFMEIAINPKEGKLFQVTTFPAENSNLSIIHIIKFDDKGFTRNRRRTNVNEGVRYAITIFTIVVEIVCIIFATLISNKISRSITALKSKTELLAEGNLETPIIIHHTLLHSNEITDLSKNLETLRLELNDQQNSRNRLIMGISHDLRTPLSVIKGYTEALSDGLIHNEEKKRETLEIIKSKTAQLNEMIESLIDFVRLNSNEWRNKLKEIDLSDFMEYNAKVCQEMGDVYNRNFTAQIEIPKYTMVKMDSQLFERAISNLMSNAIRYSSDGDTIYMKSILKSNSAEISIRDTGRGIAQEDLKQIFDIFYRASPSRREAGMGIGLAVVKNIIETHGWDIKVESELGNGSEFIITIPLEKRKMKGATFIS